MAITAAGIDAETVMPAFRPTYTLAAPITMESRIPKKTTRTVNSRLVPGGMGEGEASMGSGQKRGDGPATLAPRHLQHQSQTNSLVRVSRHSPTKPPLSGGLGHWGSRQNPNRARSGSGPRLESGC